MRVPLGMSKIKPTDEQPGHQGQGEPSAPPASLRDRVIEVLKSCYDPEIPVNIWELGLVYALEVSDEGDVSVRMTLTSPACPVAGSLPPEIQRRISELPGVRSAKVELVWDPPWTMERMSEAAKLQLGFF